MLASRREDDRTSLRIDLLGLQPPLYVRVAEQLLQHRDHVTVAVVFVVPEDDVIARLPLGLFVALRLSLLLLRNDLLDHGDYRFGGGGFGSHGVTGEWGSKIESAAGGSRPHPA